MADGAVLDEVTRRRTVLARQQLLARVTAPLPEILRRVGTIQGQHTVTNYLGLWARVDGFRRDDLTAALERRDVVLATLFRDTIHLVARDDFWVCSRAIRTARQRTILRRGGAASVEAHQLAADRLRQAFEDRPVLTRAELDAATAPVGLGASAWLDVVRVPPSGTWARRRADHFALAERWVGPEPDLSDEEALGHAVVRYLTGFGPASVKCVASFLGTTQGEVRVAVQQVAEPRYRDHSGTALYDVGDLPVVTADVPAPVRFLGQIEAMQLAHAQPTQILRDEDRPALLSATRPQGIPMFMVDGQIAGTWRHDDDEVVVSPWRPLPPSTRRALDDEGRRLATWLR